MLSFEQKKNMTKAQVFYKQISTPRNSKLAKSYWYIGASLEGKTLKAQVATLRDVAGPIITLDAQVTSSEATTYDQLVADKFLSCVPSFTPGDAEVYLNGIAVVAAKSEIQKLNPAARVGDDAVFYWDCLIVDDDCALCAGEFIVTGGVTTL